MTEYWSRRSWLAVLVGIVLVLIGASLAYGGGVLLRLGGSAYYLPTGIALVASGVLLIFQRQSGVWLYAAIYVITLVWAVAEVGLDFWQLSPRIVAPTVLAVVVLLCLAAMARASPEVGARDGRSPWSGVKIKSGYIGAAAMSGLIIAFGFAATWPHGAVYGVEKNALPAAPIMSTVGDWTAYGRTNEGRRFAPFDEINKANIGRLQVAWTAHTGDVPQGSASDENTPLQIGDKLLTCSPHNVVQALDVDTGRVLWRFDPKVTSLFWERCRSLGFHRVSIVDNAAGQVPGPEPCRERVIMTTVDARLIELDLETGRPCVDFGTAGTVDLKVGLGDVPTNFYFAASGPTVAGGLIVVGGAVIDGIDVDVPSGVIRAFDARSGALRWVWDVGNANGANAPLSGKANFTRGTPNVWAPSAVDDKLGLLFLPTGNPSPDHWGGNRSPAMEKYGSSVVALDLATGKERWIFQTVHHDLWDYDVASQPTLFDIPDGRGGRVPALIQPTKRGEIFVLDRRTGKPITPVEERPVPQGTMPGDRTSATQPFSVGMPTISPARLRERDMWGISPLDQLWCRIAFRQLRDAGNFTPPRTDPAVFFPSGYGGMNWGGVAIDESNNYLIVNDIRILQLLALIPREEMDERVEKVRKRFGLNKAEMGHGSLMPQKGTPYGAVYTNVMSPLKVPCNAPPYGTLTAIDLATKKVAWQVPMGTTEDTGPLGSRLYLQMPIGMPTIGGALTTKAGLVFFAGTQDFYLRALDSSTGHEIWKRRMPVGAGATPMSYVSSRSKRQFVVVSASGSRDSSVRGDYIIAYALPRQS